MKIFLAYPRGARRVDGIRDYATRVVEQLRAEGSEAVLLRPHRGRWLGPSLIRALPRRDPAAMVVQYNPFSWGRWGVAPDLMLALAMLRLRRTNVRIVLAIHEGYMPIRNLRWLLMGAWQRAQVRVLLGLAHGAVATAGYLDTELSRGWPRRAISHVPVGSNLPDERESRAVARATAGYEGRLVIATFSSGHVSHLHTHVAGAAAAVARSSPQPVILLLLGSNNVLSFDVPAVERIVVPGYLDERELARALSTADLFLGPFADGATTHRTTLMAALQHGVAVVTTASDRTEAMLMDGDALAFAAADDPDGFAAEAVRVGVDPTVRKQHALAGRSLYDRHFSWPVVCAGLRAAINPPQEAKECWPPGDEPASGSADAKAHA
jgi:glycosyltransferase involved in cell wall biosynthesis